MDNSKIPASPARRKELCDMFGVTIEDFSRTLMTEIILYESCYTSSEDYKTDAFEGLHCLNIYALYVNIELASLLRATLSAELPAEQRYNAKFLNSTVLEAYKYLYGYGKGRKKSLWHTKIRPLLKAGNNDAFVQDLGSLENKIVNFGESNITDQNQRDLSFHYDQKPKLVYEMLISISEEDEVKKVIPFLDLLNHITLLVQKYRLDYWPVKVAFRNINWNSIFPSFDFDVFQNQKKRLYESLSENIISFAESADQIFRYRNVKGWAKDNLEDNGSETIIHLIEISNVATHALFLYIDLASALRSFIRAEHIIEKQLAVKHINTIYYEGIDKLIGGYDKNDNSLLKKYMSPIIQEYGNDSILNEYLTVLSDLRFLDHDRETVKNQRQLSVHLFEGVRETYYMLQRLDPKAEIQKIPLILDVLPKVINISKKCLHLVDVRIQEDNKKKRENREAKADDLISLIRSNTHNTITEKQELINMLEDIKSGRVFDKLRR